MEAQVLLCYVTKPAGKSITAVIFLILIIITAMVVVLSGILPVVEIYTSNILVDSDHLLHACAVLPLYLPVRCFP